MGAELVGFGRGRRGRGFVEVWREHRARLLGEALGDREWSSLSDDDVDQLVRGTVRNAWKRRDRLSDDLVHAGRSLEDSPWTDRLIPVSVLDEADRAVAETIKRSRQRQVVGTVAAVVCVVGFGVMLSWQLRPESGGSPTSMVVCRGSTPGVQIEREITDRDPIATCEELWRPGGDLAATGQAEPVPELILCDSDGSQVVIAAPTPAVCELFDQRPVADQAPVPSGEDQLALLISNEIVDRCLQVDETVEIVEDLFDEVGVDDWQVVIGPPDSVDSDDPEDVPDVAVDRSEQCTRALVDEANNLVRVILVPAD